MSSWKKHNPLHYPSPKDAHAVSTGCFTVTPGTVEAMHCTHSSPASLWGRMGLQGWCSDFQHKFFIASKTLGQLSARTNNCFYHQLLTFHVNYQWQKHPSISECSQQDWHSLCAPCRTPVAPLAGECLRCLVPGTVGTALFKNALADTAGTAQALRTCQTILK